MGAASLRRCRQRLHSASLQSPVNSSESNTRIFAPDGGYCGKRLTVCRLCCFLQVSDFGLSRVHSQEAPMSTNTFGTVSPSTNPFHSIHVQVAVQPSVQAPQYCGRDP